MFCSVPLEATSRRSVLVLITGNVGRPSVGWRQELITLILSYKESRSCAERNRITSSPGRHSVNEKGKASRDANTVVRFSPSFPLTTTIPLVGLVSYSLFEA